MGEQLSLVLANSFNTLVERFHRAHHGFVGVVVVFICRAGRLFGLGPGLEFHFLQALLEFVELGQGLGTFFRLAKRVMGHADGGQALGLFLRNCGRLKVNRLRGADDLIPHLVAKQSFKQAHTAVTGASALPVLGRRVRLGQSVVFRVARQLDHVSGERRGVVGTTKVVEVAREPLVVVGEVRNLIRQHAVAHHVGVIHAGARLLLPG